MAVGMKRWIMLINEEQLISKMDSCKKAFLLEPCDDGRRHPLALMKISSYLKERGCDVRFGYEFFPDDYDIVFVTTLFTYSSKIVLKKIKQISNFFSSNEVIVGGIYSTLVPEHFKNQSVFPGYSKVLDQVTPDYNGFKFIEKYGAYEHQKFSYVNATRGCPNTCEYCYVGKIEPSLWVNKDFEKGIDPDRPYVNIMDNNLIAFEKQLKRVASVMREQNKKVHLEGGVDCKRATDKVIKTLASMSYIQHGLRTAFDRIEEDGIFQNFIKKSLDEGIPSTKFLVYCLINYNDTPKEANYRLEECKKLGVETYRTVFSPLDSLDSLNNSFIGKHWTYNLLQCFKEYWIKGSLFRPKDALFEEHMNKKSIIKKFKLTETDFRAWKG